VEEEVERHEIATMGAKKRPRMINATPEVLLTYCKIEEYFHSGRKQNVKVSSISQH
jgi:hypothetical protein